MKNSLCVIIICVLLCAVPTALGQSGDFEGEIEMDGVIRTYHVHVPSGYDPNGHAVPLVLNFHGLASNAVQQAYFSDMSRLADQAGFIIAYPQGLGVPARWDMRPASQEPPNDDLAFIRALVSHLQAEFHIDPARIYATGMSNGGGFSNRLACEAADIFAAVAPVAGAYGYHDACDPERPMPVLAFHGTKDPIVPYNGMTLQAEMGWISTTLPPVPDWAAGWAARNACASDPEKVAEGRGVTAARWSGCAEDAEVILYTIEGIGHVWPGSEVLLLGPTGPVDATELIWAFFETHPMP